MHRDSDLLGPAISGLTRFINDPRHDRHLMAEAGLTFDPAFMPLLVRLGASGEAGVVELAGQLGRDHSTVSRQMAKLEVAGLLERLDSPTDGRVRTARLTAQGLEAFAALGKARRRLLDHAMVDWDDRERGALSRLLSRFVQDLQSAAESLARAAIDMGSGADFPSPPKDAPSTREWRD